MNRTPIPWVKNPDGTQSYTWNPIPHWDGYFACKEGLIASVKRGRAADWVIIGAMTGKKKDLIELNKRYPKLTLLPYGNKWTLQPPTEWVEEIVRACDMSGVSVFLKDNLKPLVFDDPLFAEGLVTWAGELRQEVPR